MTRLTPYQVGDARHPRQPALTNLAFGLWLVPVLVLLAVMTYASTGAPTASLLATTHPWPELRGVVPAASFGTGTALGLLALARSTVRHRWTVVVVLCNAVALVVTALVVAGPTLAGAIGR